jgi:hypothetical protein
VDFPRERVYYSENNLLQQWQVVFRMERRFNDEERRPNQLFSLYLPIVAIFAEACHLLLRVLPYVLALYCLVSDEGTVVARASFLQRMSSTVWELEEKTQA